MLPVPGDVFAVFNDRMQAYVAMQVTHVRSENKSTQAAVLVLSPTFDALPRAAQLADMQPARFDFYFWNDRLQHVWASADVPRGYTHVGHTRPLIEDETNAYAQWPDGDLFDNQRRWNTIPQADRDHFKQAAADDDETVVLETPHGMKIRRSATRLFTEDVKVIPNLATFDDLPTLTSVHVVEPIDGLIDFIRRRPFIHEAGIRNHGLHTIDVRDTYLTRFIIDVTGVRDLYVNDAMEMLSLVGTADPALTIHQAANGRWLSLNANDVPLVWSGLDALSSLLLGQVRDVDAAAIAQRFPALHELRIWGAPAVLQQVHALSTLGKLRTLTLSDVFGYEAVAFPPPDAWPHLGQLWLTSLPADVAAAVKKAYKPAVRGGLDLAVRQPRKPEWLAENLDNPFRDWDGMDQITPAQAKKAADLYRKARAAAIKIAAETPGSQASVNAADGDAAWAAPVAADLTIQPAAPLEADVTAALAPVVTTYTQGFNALDRRAGFIETVEREAIFEALMGIIDAVDEKRVALFGPDTIPVNRDAILAAMDEVRDF
ncbi:hypothetical protein RBI13_14040 [Alcaligenaceae bacterium A4P071]|nr:hypothetical protein [Alcaligenaceae bacterium A4P071]